MLELPDAISTEGLKVLNVIFYLKSPFGLSYYFDSEETNKQKV